MFSGQLRHNDFGWFTEPVYTSFDGGNSPSHSE